ncbi:hypothetical protein MQE36_16250 [Zhouia spongiae]|uniref:DUF4340 domain-containing protein n=1 Tax=Zhouia spongiae TaxID=2202721 RepID=A0ABY3YLP5_9FLAO|nr:hypothetical protein [Zhouia spongiae]UNY98618.1 hypothetical protein MQE36_16250 [Zhouia spongiae]
MKNVLIKLSVYLFLGITSVIVLYGISHKMTHKKNSFNRLFPPHPVKKMKSFDLKFNSFYFAGTGQHEVYLSNATATLYFLTLRLTPIDTSHVVLSVEHDETKKFASDTRVEVLPPYFYIVDGVTPQLLRGTLGDWKTKKFMYDSVYFSKAIPIGAKSFALRAVSSATKEFVLGKLADNPPHIKLTPGILQKQIDGIFCVDGMLHYNRELDQIIYLYHYRNQYMVMDTILNLLRTGKTIDTNNVAKIQISAPKVGRPRKMSAPPFLVNKQSSTSANLLFVCSNLMAKNEDKKSFKESSVIDVYDLEKDVYEFSFYLPDYKGYKVTDFRVAGNYLVALHNRYLVVYLLEPRRFDNIYRTK